MSNARASQKRKRPGSFGWFWRVRGAYTSPKWTSEFPLTAGTNERRKSAATRQRTTSRALRTSRQRTRAGVTGMSFHGGGAEIGGWSNASATRSTRPCSPSGGSEVTMRLTTGSPKSPNGVSAPGRSGFQYVPCGLGSAVRSARWT